MIKCDFCKEYDPRTRYCGSYTGSSACDEAARKFLQFMKGNRTHTKNINVHKTTKKVNYKKKRY